MAMIDLMPQSNEPPPPCLQARFFTAALPLTVIVAVRRCWSCLSRTVCKERLS